MSELSILFNPIVSILVLAIETAFFASLLLTYRSQWAKWNTNPIAGIRTPNKEKNKFEAFVITAYVITMIILVAIIMSV